jgi:hypothetical protein
MKNGFTDAEKEVTIRKTKLNKTFWEGKER